MNFDFWGNAPQHAKAPGGAFCFVVTYLVRLKVLYASTRECLIVV